MTAISHAVLRRIPKAELHCHLDGSVRPATLLELGRALGVELPAATEHELAHHMYVRDARHLEDYLTRFDVTLSVMQSRETLERITYELCEDAAADGVRYIEVRYAPVLNTAGGLSLEAAVEAPLAALARARRDCGIVARIVICGLRHLSPTLSLELARLAVRFQGRGVVGFDLAGGEAGHPASAHRAAFRHARDHGMCCTCHAGEGAGAESVADAVHACGVQRIGHGTRLIEDPRLTDELAGRGIAIEACLTSNVQTRAVPDYASHPLRAYFERGMRVTLNTDNRLMSATTLTAEYAHAANELHFTLDELCTLARNGFESAFLPDDERRALLAEVDRDFAALRAEAARTGMAWWPRERAWPGGRVNGHGLVAA
jgi:adenosine deaminase